MIVKDMETWTAEYKAWRKMPRNRIAQALRRLANRIGTAEPSVLKETPGSPWQDYVDTQPLMRPPRNIDRTWTG